MMIEGLYDILLFFIILISPLILITLLFVTAPYGRHTKKGWGITLDNRWAWFWMEIPAVLTIAVIYMCYSINIHPASIVFLIIWECHYCYRTFYFPFKLRATKKSFPLLLVLFAIVFNIINGYINGIFLFRIRPLLDHNWLYSWQFIIGLALFFIGFIIHYSSDRTIISLRKNKDIDYAIPYGGLFRFVSNPNYLGEFIQWTGWAILTWSLAGASFALFTLANLLPRAIANHKWYKEKFNNYPVNRKAFFPFII